MTIYTQEFPSTKAMPYVYRGYNPTTGEFYIGYHMRNVKKNISSTSDLGVVYFTSSKLVKPRFHEFIWTIVAEFFDGDSAYDFEQLLIFESWKQPGSLNKSCYHGKARFNITGVPHSDETKRKMSIAQKGVPRELHSEETKLKMSIAASNMSDESKRKMSIAKKGKSNGPRSDETKLKISIANKGKPKSDEAKLKMSIAKKGIPRPKHECLHCGKWMSVNNLARYHGDKCKKLVTILLLSL